MVNPRLSLVELRRYNLVVVFIVQIVLLVGLTVVNGDSANASTIRLCKRYQHVAVRSHDNGSFVVRNDFWGTRAMCMDNINMRPNFKVTKIGRNKISGKVMSFPYVFMGCSWGICTRHSGLPARASALHRPEATWRTSGHASGQWDAAFDLWFGRHRMTNGQATGAELMIWLNSRNLAPASHHIVRLDGVRWYLAHWTTHLGGKSWHYIQFRRVHPVWGVKNLRLNPFIHHAERLRLVSRRWWLLNIEAGFELLHGGKGLAGRRFWARA